MTRALWLVAACVAFATALQPAAAQRAPVKVVASFSVLGDMVQNVGGDKIALTTLVGANGDTHVYQPTPADAKAVAEARLFIVNGLGLEGWLPRLVGAVGFKGKVATVSDGIKPLTMEDEDAPKAGGKTKRVADPHAWQSLANGRIYVANIVTALSEVDPEDAAFYRERGEAYSRQLAALDEKVKAELATVPKAKRRVITSHDAFQYYGKAYGVEFVAPLGISTESEASAGDIAKLIRQIRKEKVKALFIENVSDPRLIEQLAKEAGAVVGPPLYSDALSKPGEPGATYLAMFEHNTAALKAGMLRN
jgi:zinc/manganese transport system substrate-binding protein